MLRPKWHLLPALVTALLLVVPALCGCGQDVRLEQGPAQGQSQVEAEEQSRPSHVRVHFVDVGKGDCILVQADGLAALIDTGYEDTADEVVSYARERGVDRLSCVVITHYDRDHVGGLGAIGKAIPIDTAYLPGYEGGDKNYRTVTKAVDNLGLPSRAVTRETQVELGSALLTIFPTSLSYVPNADGDEGNDNDLSLVVSLTNFDDSYLFAGDLEKDGIAAYLKGSHGPFDILKMPHHGRRNANTDELIEDVQPKVAVITDARKDPADGKTLSLLEDAGVDTYRTSMDGTVVVESDGSGSYKVSVEKG